MGDPRKTRKQSIKPRKPLDKRRLDSERELVRAYGLKNKRELWRIETILRRKRKSARALLALDLEKRIKREKELVQSMQRLGLVHENAVLDDVLTLSTESLLERRLQTVVWRKGLANTANQARQFITHGHIAIGGKKIDKPSYLVPAEEENKIAYYGKKMELKPKVPEKKQAGAEEKSLEADPQEAAPKESGIKAEQQKRIAGEKTSKKKEDAEKTAEKKGKEKATGQHGKESNEHAEKADSVKSEAAAENAEAESVMKNE